MEGATWQNLATALADVGEEESAEKVNNYRKVSCNSVQLTASSKYLTSASVCFTYLQSLAPCQPVSKPQRQHPKK